MATTIDRAGVEQLARKLSDISLEVSLWALNAVTEVDKNNLTRVSGNVAKVRDMLLEVGRAASSRERVSRADTVTTGPVWWRGLRAFALGRSWLMPWRVVVLTLDGDMHRVRRSEVKPRVEYYGPG